MRVVIEINGERHRLIRKGTTGFMDQCGKCSLKKVCLGPHSKDSELIHEICHINYNGYRKVRKETK